MVDDSKGKLRTGFTTGTCATASAKAAMLSILHQKQIEEVNVKLPKGDLIKIKINSCKFNQNTARCSVIKDGGDDPDVTHGAEIIVDLSLTTNTNCIEIDGGEGVGFGRCCRTCSSCKPCPKFTLRIIHHVHNI